jgi:hypothetical protein
MMAYFDKYIKFLVTRMGYRSMIADVGQWVTSIVDPLIETYEAKNYICAMKYYDMDGYKSCISN